MIFDWVSQHKLLLGTVAGLSTGLLLISIIATPWLVAQLPANYLLPGKTKPPRHPVVHFAIVSSGTLIGSTLILLGLIMLVMPGPGLITLLLGISICSFPGKGRLFRHIASRDSVFASLNWMRRRHGKAALIHPHHKQV